MIINWLRFNLTILIYKITNRKHESDLHKYVFRNYQSYCQKIDEEKDPFDCVNFDCVNFDKDEEKDPFDKIDNIVRQRKEGLL